MRSSQASHKLCQAGFQPDTGLPSQRRCRMGDRQVRTVVAMSIGAGVFDAA
jgi:hypothetical protein